MSVSSSPDSAELRKAIVKAISATTIPRRVTRGYVVGLVFTACAVLLLPLLYLAVLLLVLEGTFLLVLRFDSIFVDCHPLLKYPVIAMVLCIGVSCVIGLVKPLFAANKPIRRPKALHRDTQRFLYDYVDRLCDVLGAHRPTDIHVTCDMNAAAEFQRGWQNPFGHRRVSLYLGLPLIAGVTVRQFTGILSHELGHFSQRKGMWFENIVRRANHWFIKAATEHDRVDIWLAERCALGGITAIPCFFARFVVWITRQILCGLARIGTLISCLMSRQMEFSADQCQVSLVGSKTMAATLWRIRELSLAHQVAFRDVAAFHEEGRLPDSMSDLVLANLEFITPKLRRKLYRFMLDEKSGAFDSHPTDLERISKVADDLNPGLFQTDSLPIDLSATVIFNQFDDLSRATSIQFFENALQQKISAKLLHPVNRLLERQMAQIEATRALRRYFQTDIPVHRPLPIPRQVEQAPDDAREIAAELRACRKRMLDELTNYRNLAPRYRFAEETLLDATAALTLTQAQIVFDPARYRLSSASSEVISGKLSRAREAIATLAGKLLNFETEAGHRLSFALQLLHVPAVIERIPEGHDLQYHTFEYLSQACYLQKLLGELPAFRLSVVKLRTLVEKTKGTTPVERVRALIEALVTQIRERMETIQADMGDRLYPFDHARAETTLKNFVVPHIPGERSPALIADAGEQLLSRLSTIQWRLFAQLAIAAEKVELAIGMSALPTPQRERDD